MLYYRKTMVVVAHHSTVEKHNLDERDIELSIICHMLGYTDNEPFRSVFDEFTYHTLDEFIDKAVGFFKHEKKKEYITLKTKFDEAEQKFGEDSDEATQVLEDLYDYAIKLMNEAGFYVYTSTGFEEIIQPKLDPKYKNTHMYRLLSSLNNQHITLQSQGQMIN